MEAINWAPVGVVLTIVTGVAALATADFQTVLVTVMAFSAGVAVGRHPIRYSPSGSQDGGVRE